MTSARPSRIQRVLFVAATSQALSRTWLAMARAIRSHGHKVHCLLGATTPAHSATLEQAGIVVETIDLQPSRLLPFGDLQVRRRLGQRITALAPELALAVDLDTAALALPLARLTGTERRVALLAALPAELHAMAAETTQRTISARLGKTWVAAIEAATDLVLPDGDDLRLASRLGEARDGLRLHQLEPNVVDVSTSASTPLPHGPVRLLVWMPGQSASSVERVVEAARRARDAGGKFTLVLAGTPTEAAALAATEQAARRHDWIAREASAITIAIALAGAHALIAPAVEPSQNLNHSGILDALAAGRAIVAEDARGVVRAIDDAVNGRRVPAGDIDALSKAISATARHQTLLVAMGLAARRKAEQRFDHALLAPRWRAALRLDG